MGIGAMLGPIIGGALYSAGGFMIPFFGMAGVLVVLTPFVFWKIPKDQKSGLKKRTLELTSAFTPEVLMTMLCSMSATIGYVCIWPNFANHMMTYNI